MIQTKTEILCLLRSQKFGILKIVVDEPVPDGIGGIIYSVKDFIKSNDGSESLIKSKQITYSKLQLDNTDAYIEANYAEELSGLSRTDKEYKKVCIGLMLDTVTNLCWNGLTTYGLTPSDWEFSE